MSEKSTVEENRRMEALVLAVSLAKSPNVLNFSTNQIIKTAESFEKYLEHGTA